MICCRVGRLKLFKIFYGKNTGVDDEGDDHFNSMAQVLGGHVSIDVRNHCKNKAALLDGLVGFEAAILVWFQHI